MSRRKRKGLEGAEEFNWTGFGAFRHHLIVLLLSAVAVISAVGAVSKIQCEVVLV